MAGYDDDPNNMHVPTTLVRIQKRNGKLVNEYDEYIGPWMKSKHHDLPCSQWWLPFLDCNRGSPEKQDLSKYKKEILNNPKLSGQLHTLIGKRLGTFSDITKPSYGDALIELVHEYCPERTYLGLPNEMLLFKGERTPLCNYYPSSLVYKGITFKCASHLFSYVMLRNIGMHDVAKRICECTDISEINKLYYSTLKHTPKRCSTKKTVLSMIDVISEKYDQCPELRNCLKETEDKILVEGTKSKFWSGGLDIKCVDKSCGNNSFTGRNYLGWILKFVHFMNSGKMPQWNRFIQEKVECNRHDLDYNFYRGIMNVDRFRMQKK